MRFFAHIDMEDAAFDYNGVEVARILRETADKIEARRLEELDSGPIMDINGNKVGEWEVAEELHVTVSVEGGACQDVDINLEQPFSYSIADKDEIDEDNAG